MKRFIRYMVLVSMNTLILAYVLDFIYTKTFLKSFGRQKVDFIYNSDDLSYDVIILGSSRANNHIVPQFFEERGIRTINFGMSGAYLPESALMLKLFLERGHQTKRVILEADISLTQEGMSDVIASKFLPYLHDSPSVKSQFSGNDDFWALYYVPFYRYAVSDFNIGFREMILAAAGKNTIHMNDYGYTALVETPGIMQLKMDPSELRPNRYYEEIKQLCRLNGIELIVITTPVCDLENTSDFFESLKLNHPEIIRFDQIMPDIKYYVSCGHMNDLGATTFTKKLVDFYQNHTSRAAIGPDAPLKPTK